MTIAVLTKVYTEEELRRIFPGESVHLIRVFSLEEGLSCGPVDAFFDLDFIPDAGRIEVLRRLQPALIVINSVEFTLAETDPGFVRINGWPGFLQREWHELAVADAEIGQRAAEIYQQLGHGYRMAPDVHGLITGRILVSIINEAWYTLEDKVSSMEGIDTAMKLGTNYPMGPFEWGKQIGLEKVGALLDILGRENPRYIPATSLQREIGIKI